MTLLSTIKDVCVAVGVLQPTSVFSNIGGNRTMQEMLALANEMAQRIAYDHREWTMMRAGTFLDGDGVKVDFNLPANLQRMLLTTNVYRSTAPNTPMRFIPDADEWTQRRLTNYVDSRGEWTIYGGQMHIYPIMGVGTRAAFVYLDKNCVTLASGGFGDAFTADNDSFRLQERLLKLGMIWQWKANKGSAYAEDMSTYNDALNVAAGADQPKAILVNRMPISANVQVAYPWPVPT
jgi:hypothetical protein